MGDATAAMDLITKPLARPLPHNLTFKYLIYSHILIQKQD